MMRSLPLLLLLLIPLPLVAQQPATQPAAPTAVTPAELERQIGAMESPAELRVLAQRFRGVGDFASEAVVLERLVKLRPHQGALRLELAATYAQLDRKSETYNALLELQQQGYGFDIRDDKRFVKVATTEAWEYIVTGLETNRKPFGAGAVAHTLPREDLLIESLAWDPTRKALLVGSAREGKVFVVKPDGKLETLVTADERNGLWAVFDLAVDAQRGLLWVASTAVPHFRDYRPEKDLGRAGVFKFNLRSGALIDSYLSPTVPGQSFFMSSLALGAQGEVYAADGVNNTIYVVADGRFRRLMHAPMLESIRGMTVSTDGKILYFADHARGLFGLDLATTTPFDVMVPKTLALGGIDGVTLWNDQLIVVQNGMQPKRVMRLALSPDGRAIAGMQPLAANLDAFTLPTMATVAGDKVYLIANSQKNNYDRFGLLIDPAKLEPAHIYAVPTEVAEPAAAKRTVVPGR